MSTYAKGRGRFYAKYGTKYNQPAWKRLQACQKPFWKQIGKVGESESANKSGLAEITLEDSLKVWCVQLLENAIEREATQITLQLYRSGMDGFDMVDNGKGIKKEDWEDLCKCQSYRERNNTYKTRSIGYKGEGLETLCFYTELEILTKEKEAEFGHSLKFDKNDRSLVTMDPVEDLEEGTIIKVRNVYYENEEYKNKYLETISKQFDDMIEAFTSYGCILNSIVVTVMNDRIPALRTVGASTFAENTLAMIHKTRGAIECDELIEVIVNNLPAGYKM